MVELIYIITSVIVFIVAQCMFRLEVIENDLTTELLMGGVCFFTAVFWPMIFLMALFTLVMMGLEKITGLKNA